MNRSIVMFVAALLTSNVAAAAEFHHRSDGKPHPKQAKQKMKEYNRLIKAGYVAWNKRDFVKYVELNQRAVRIYDLAAPRYNLARGYALLGRRKQALAELEKAVEKGYRLVESIEKDASFKSLKADKEFRRILERAVVLAEEDRKLQRVLLQLQRLHAQATKAFRAQDYKSAERLVRNMLKLIPSGKEEKFPFYCNTSHYMLSSALAVRGKKEEALAHLERAFQTGFRDIPWLMKDSDFNSLHEEPRFKNLLAKYGKGAKRSKHMDTPPSEAISDEPQPDHKSMPKEKTSDTPPSSAKTGIEVSYRPSFKKPKEWKTVFRMKQGPAGASVDNKTGRFVWTPAKDQVGVHQINIVAVLGRRMTIPVEKWTITVHEE